MLKNQSGKYVYINTLLRVARNASVSRRKLSASEIASISEGLPASLSPTMDVHARVGLQEEIFVDAVPTDFGDHGRRSLTEVPLDGALMAALLDGISELVRCRLSRILVRPTAST